MKKLLAIALISSTLSTGAYAECSDGACSNVTIDYLLVMSSGTITVGTSGTETGLTCTASGGKYLEIGKDDIGKNAMYAALLTAQTTGKKLSIRVNDDDAACKITYVMAKI